MGTTKTKSRPWRAAALFATVALVLGTTACGGDDGDDGGSGGEGGEASADTTSPAGSTDDVLYVLITNSEGLTAPGLDAVVQAVYPQPKTATAAVAPDVETLVPPPPLAEGQVPATVFAPTAGGFPGIVVAADAPDTVRVAVAGTIDGLPEGQGTPDLVVAGVNTGQLIGSLADFSSNVPAAQAAVDAGIPALVVAQGVDEAVPDYAAGAAQAFAWIEEHRDALLAGDEPAQVTLLNVPSCALGEVRGVVEVPVAADDPNRDLATVDCTSTAEDPVDDVAAFTTGYATLSVLPAADATSPTTTAAPAAPPTTG